MEEFHLASDSSGHSDPQGDARPAAGNGTGRAGQCEVPGSGPGDLEGPGTVSEGGWTGRSLAGGQAGRQEGLDKGVREDHWPQAEDERAPLAWIEANRILASKWTVN